MNKKVREHIPSGFLMSMILSFKETKKIMIYTEVKIAWKKWWMFKKICKKNNWFRKKNINKRTGGSYKKVKFFCIKGETFEDKCVNDKKLQSIFLNSQS